MWLRQLLFVLRLILEHLRPPYILGAGFPETLPVLAWRYFNDANIEMRLMGMATVVTLTVMVSVVLYLYLKTYRMYEQKRGRQ